MLKLVASAFLMAIAAVPATSASPAIINVDLANFRFAPAVIQLRAGVPTVLQLRNTAGGGHNFAAPAFFAASRLDARSAALIRKGRVEVPARSTMQIALVPAAGDYRLTCTHTFHGMFGMNGRIIVR